MNQIDDLIDMFLSRYPIFAQDILRLEDTNISIEPNAPLNPAFGSETVPVYRYQKRHVARANPYLASNSQRLSNKQDQVRCA